MNYKRLFYNWLQKERIYNIFFHNVLIYSYTMCKFSSGKRLFEHMVKIMNKNPENYISSFIWIDTFQGYDYWATKHRNWNEYLNQWKLTH